MRYLVPKAAAACGRQPIRGQHTPGPARRHPVKRPLHDLSQPGAATGNQVRGRMACRRPASLRSRAGRECPARSPVPRGWQDLPWPVQPGPWTAACPPGRRRGRQIRRRHGGLREPVDRVVHVLVPTSGRGFTDQHVGKPACDARVSSQAGDSGKWLVAALRSSEDLGNMLLETRTWLRQELDLFRR